MTPLCEQGRGDVVGSVDLLGGAHGLSLSLPLVFNLLRNYEERITSHHLSLVHTDEQQRITCIVNHNQVIPPPPSHHPVGTLGQPS